MDIDAGNLVNFALIQFLRATVVITTNMGFSEWGNVIGDPEMTTALLDRLAHHRHMVDTGNESWQIKNSSARLQPGRTVRTRKFRANKTKETETYPQIRCYTATHTP